MPTCFHKYTVTKKRCKKQLNIVNDCFRQDNKSCFLDSLNEKLRNEVKANSLQILFQNL
jgi:hypothetical protein